MLVKRRKGIKIKKIYKKNMETNQMKKKKEDWFD
jgi:hypothetical protein